MAPKKSTMIQTKYINTQRRKPNETSTADDSSWRPLDDAQVQKWLGVIRRGDYMNTTIEQPSLMAENGELLVSSHDGGCILRNGKQFTRAMQLIQDEVVLMTEEVKNDSEWLNEVLLDHLLNGVPYSVYEFVGVPYDRLQHCVVECYKHEDSSNDIALSTLGDRARLALAFFQKCRCDWTAAKKDMMSIMGSTKESRIIDRWICIAREVPEGLLEHIQQWREIPLRYVVGNRHLVGKGEEMRCKLGPVWAKVAFNWYGAMKEDNEDITAEHFTGTICLAAKHAEAWENAIVKRYGFTATSFAAFTRGVDWLKSPLGLKKIKTWMFNNDLRKQPNFADSALTTIVEEMEKVKAGTSKVPGGEEARETERVRVGAGMTALGDGAGNSARPMEVY